MMVARSELSIAVVSRILADPVGLAAQSGEELLVHSSLRKQRGIRQIA